MFTIPQHIALCSEVGFCSHTIKPFNNVPNETIVLQVHYLPFTQTTGEVSYRKLVSILIRKLASFNTKLPSKFIPKNTTLPSETLCTCVYKQGYEAAHASLETVVINTVLI